MDRLGTAGKKPPAPSVPGSCGGSNAQSPRGLLAEYRSGGNHWPRSV